MNIKQQWEIGRAISFYIVKSNTDSKIQNWKQLFPVPGDKVTKKKDRAMVRKSTEEENEILKQMTNG